MSEAIIPAAVSEPLAAKQLPKRKRKFSRHLDPELLIDVANTIKDRAMKSFQTSGIVDVAQAVIDTLDEAATAKSRSAVFVVLKTLICMAIAAFLCGLTYLALVLRPIGKTVCRHEAKAELVPKQIRAVSR